MSVMLTFSSTGMLPWAIAARAMGEGGGIDETSGTPSDFHFVPVVLKYEPGLRCGKTNVRSTDEPL